MIAFFTQSAEPLCEPFCMPVGSVTTPAPYRSFRSYEAFTDVKCKSNWQFPRHWNHSNFWSCFSSVLLVLTWLDDETID